MRQPAKGPSARARPGPKPALGVARSAAIAVRTTPEILVAAKRAAWARRRSLSSWVEGLIIKGLEGGTR